MAAHRESEDFETVLITVADFANLSLLDASPPLRRLLARATVVASDSVPPHVVTMNSQVLVCDASTGERRVMSVVYPGDADARAGRVSVLTEAGAQLLGASAGQVIEYDSRRLRVEQVLYQPEHSLRTHLVTRTSARGAG
jgi:regulator of nucleoside diphosphate kinase